MLSVFFPCMNLASRQSFIGLKKLRKTGESPFKIHFIFIAKFGVMELSIEIASFMTKKPFFETQLTVM